jgi:DNA-binding winged helix-turn-helix (wHTH) protein
VVTRDELRRYLWPNDTFVDFDHGLNVAIKRLRDALGDAAGTPRSVETLLKRGYRFIAPISAGSTNAPGSFAGAPERDAASGNLPSSRRTASSP